MEAIVELSRSSDFSSDDSESDPSNTELEETRSKISKLSIRNKSKAIVVEEIDDEIEIAESEIDEVDEKSFEEVQRIIGACEFEKLKVEQCKVYLRKKGLRLTGNKATLVHRIKEHLEISNGGGERKYPVSSFVVSCTGDACTGDVVLFKQNVYDTFSVVSRSASGPPCGTRMVAGRILKESYGAAKQQHTFTVEVLWSKGEKPLPPLHPLLIKGRNLYRMKTLRQKWEDEEERQKMLTEKHSRGSLARSKRESRIQEMENRKILKKNRILKKETNVAPSQFDSTSALSSKPPTVLHQTGLAANSGKSVAEKVIANQISNHSIQNKYIDQATPSLVGNRSLNNRESVFVQPIGNWPHPRFNEYRNPFFCIDNRPMSPLRGHEYCQNNYRPTSPSRQYFEHNYRAMSPSRRQYNENYYRPTSPSRRPYQLAQKPCHYYAQGKCRYGERCKYLH